MGDRKRKASESFKKECESFKSRYTDGVVGIGGGFEVDLLEEITQMPNNNAM